MDILSKEMDKMANLSNTTYIINRECLGIKLKFCGFFSLSPGEYRIYENKPDDYSLTFMEMGSYFVKYANSSFNFSSGDLCIFKPNQFRYFKNTSNTILKEYWFTFEVDNPAKFAKVINNKPIHTGCSGKIPFLLQETYRTASTKKLSPEKIAVLFLQAISEISVHKNIKKISSNEEKINKIIEKIRDNPLKTWDFKKLAMDAHISYSSFRHLFKEITNTSPLLYQNKEKIKLACTYLIQGFSVKETSFKIGIKDQYYFSRLFKQIINQTPTEFKKSI